MLSISRQQPTLAAPTARALAGGLSALAVPGRYVGEIERQAKTLYSGSSVVTYSRGRAALASALKLAMRATGRDTIVLPAYTSFSVAAAAAAAGARVRLCDLDPETLDFDRSDLRECVDRSVAAVILGNLYGYPSRIDDIDWVRGTGALLIDDAAQALGARDRSRPLGSRGHLGVLSFGRGKCVTTGDGGALLINDQKLRRFIDEVRPGPGGRGLADWLVALAVRLSSSRLAFGLLSRMPGARIAESHYNPDFAIASASASARGLACDLATAAVGQLEIRRRVAGYWQDALQASRSLRALAVSPEVDPAYLRFPVFAADRVDREELVKALAGSGFCFVRSYPTTLGRIEDFRRAHCEDRPTPGAESISETVIALPCHARVTKEDVRKTMAVACQSEGRISKQTDGSPAFSRL